MAMDSLPKRKRPAHWVSHEKGNQSVIVFATVCTKARAKLLATPEMHEHIVDAWKTAEFWKVGRYVIMSDHIHFFCSPGSYPTHPFRKWVGFWKNRIVKNSGVRGFWQRDVWDTQLRRGESYSAKWQYVRENPVRAGLVDRSNEWAYQGELEPLWWHDA